MRKTNSLFLTHVVLAISAILFMESCASVNVNNQSLDKNSAIVRIYVGLNSNKTQRDIEVEEVEEIISKHFSASTLQPSTGYYEGLKEKSLIVTIINCCRWVEPNEKFRNRINNLVLQLRDDLGQESILVEFVSNGRTEAFEVTD